MQVNLPGNQTSINFDNVLIAVFRPGDNWFGDRRLPRSQLQKNLIKFLKFWRKPHRNNAQWHVGATRRLYS